MNFVDPDGLNPYNDPRLNGRGVPAAMGGDGKPGPYYPNQFPDGPFGPICGSGSSASWIPDVCPKACQKHDDCYGTHGASKDQCDYELYKSFPPYGAAVYLFGRDPYNNAQKNSNPKR